MSSDLCFVPLLLGAGVSRTLGLRNEPYVRRARFGIALTAAGLIAALAAVAHRAGVI